jgi:hypothetical protein
LCYLPPRPEIDKNVACIFSMASSFLGSISEIDPREPQKNISTSLILFQIEHCVNIVDENSVVVKLLIGIPDSWRDPATCGGYQERVLGCTTLFVNKKTSVSAS